jgi:hypothetical protein
LIADDAGGLLFRFIGPSHMSKIREVRLIGCDDRDLSFQATEKLLFIVRILMNPSPVFEGCG